MTLAGMRWTMSELNAAPSFRQPYAPVSRPLFGIGPRSRGGDARPGARGPYSLPGGPPRSWLVCPGRLFHPWAGREFGHIAENLRPASAAATTDRRSPARADQVP